MSAVPSVGRADTAALGVDATRVLYERYSRRIFAYCISRLGDRSEAEDAMQTTFLNAFRSLNRGVVPEFELAWLFRIAENVCRDGHKSTSRRRRLEAARDLDEVQDVVSAPPQTQDGLVGLTDALARMPERQRRAILLREWQGLSYSEIARELDLSIAAVETLIFRARRSLARGLEGRRASGFNVVSLLAAAKSFLQGGAAAKVAASAAAVAGAALLAGLPLADQPRSARAGNSQMGAAANTSAPGQASASSVRSRDGRAPARSQAPPRAWPPTASVGEPSGSVPAGGVVGGDMAAPTTASGEREPGTLTPGGDGSTAPANPPPSLGPVPGLPPVSPPALPELPSVPDLPPVVPPPPAVEPPALPPLPDSPVSGPEVPPLPPLPPLP